MSAGAAVSVIGLGRMGSALAQALLLGGIPLVVCNRTRARCEPLREQGATVAVGIAEALAQSSTALVSVADYAAAGSLFFGTEGPDLRGKTLIQLSSGTPQEAREWSLACAERGGQTLTGAILGYPMHIGTPQAQLLISGPEDLYAGSRDLLALLGAPTHVGEAFGGSSALDCAVLAGSMLSIIGLIQGIELCRSESVDPARLVDITNALLAAMPQVNEMILQAVLTRDYADPQAAIDTWEATAGHIADIVARNRMAPPVSHMLTKMFAHAHAAGLGGLDISALAELLRASPKP
ncbi:MAG TPA: NAD(P)-binding domain-containing protein [Caulobacteraceae bacterium]|nr:NAD(P)-binding domain-containing protein [Caulobacteraceae bacterium]